MTNNEILCPSNNPEIPRRMVTRPRDVRGFPIPYVQFIATNGEPDFRILDHGAVLRCLTGRRCALCGLPMGRHVYFIGGPLCEANGFFYDPPMHKDCAEFALRACPHIARIKGRYRAEEPDLGDKLGAIIVKGAMPDRKAEWFSLMHCTSFTFGRDNTGMIMVRAVLPWLDVQRWQDGKPLEPVTASDTLG
jgi:hypothetical protein